jgi:hypothetical protein
MTNFVNITPHTINLNDGTAYHPSGVVGSVTQNTTDFTDNIATSSFGALEIPQPVDGVVYIASMVVAQSAAAIGRMDVVAPATRHDETIRNDRGHIVSVPGFIRF